MVGSGTTLVECKLLGRRSVGVDINPDAVMVARNRLDFSYAPLDADYVTPEIKTYVGDARSLDLIGSQSIDLIATHPPYASIIPYSHDRDGDLSIGLESTAPSSWVIRGATSISFLSRRGC